MSGHPVRDSRLNLRNKQGSSTVPHIPSHCINASNHKLCLACVSHPRSETMFSYHLPQPAQSRVLPVFLDTRSGTPYRQQNREAESQYVYPTRINVLGAARALQCREPRVLQPCRRLFLALLYTNNSRCMGMIARIHHPRRVRTAMNTILLWMSLSTEIAKLNPRLKRENRKARNTILKNSLKKVYTDSKLECRCGCPISFTLKCVAPRQSALS